MRKTIATIALLSATVSGAAVLPAAHAEDAYPSRVVRLIVPASAGGVTDLVARIAGEYLSDKFKQQFIVVNRTGAGGNLGTDDVAKSDPDGYTLGVVATGNVVINPYIYKSMPFDAKTDLIPVASIAEAPQVIAVGAGVPAKTLQELIALAKAKPNGVAYASAGAGTTMHLAGDQFARLAGVQITHVPYRGAAPAVTDIVAGNVQIIPVSVGPIMGFVRNGQIRVLAAASPHRLKALPDVPTTAEAGLPGYEMTTWFGIVAPKGTPPAIVATIHDAVQAMLTDPATVKRLEDNYLELMPMSQPEFARFVTAEFPKWEQAVKATGVQPE
jgi:tripartite-type tricarboxylate transporter receptor subunit TctC